jgi:hypothetical protein
MLLPYESNKQSAILHGASAWPAFAISPILQMPLPAT